MNQELKALYTFCEGIFKKMISKTKENDRRNPIISKLLSYRRRLANAAELEAEPPNIENTLALINSYGDGYKVSTALLVKVENELGEEVKSFTIISKPTYNGKYDRRGVQKTQ